MSVMVILNFVYFNTFHEITMVRDIIKDFISVAYHGRYDRTMVRCVS